MCTDAAISAAIVRAMVRLELSAGPTISVCGNRRRVRRHSSTYPAAVIPRNGHSSRWSNVCAARCVWSRSVTGTNGVGETQSSGQRGGAVAAIAAAGAAGLAAVSAHAFASPVLRFVRVPRVRFSVRS